MKVRVPKELRPPSRYGLIIYKPRFDLDWEVRGTFRVKGCFREPKEGEFYWSKQGKVFQADNNWETSGPRVILERVSP